MSDRQEEGIARLRAGEAFRVELQQGHWFDGQQVKPRAVLYVYLYNPSGRLSSRPYFSLVHNPDDPQQSDTFASLLHSLARALEADTTEIDQEGGQQ